MRTKTVCLKVHLNYFKDSIPKWYAHTFTVDSHISVMVTFWEPPCGSWNTIQDPGVTRQAIHSVQEDGTWSDTKAVRCSKEPHTYTLIWHKTGKDTWNTFLFWSQKDSLFTCNILVRFANNSLLGLGLGLGLENKERWKGDHRPKDFDGNPGHLS